MGWVDTLQNPDDVTADVLRLVFGSGVIVAIFLVINFVIGWYSAGRAVFSFGISVRSGLSGAMTRASSSRRSTAAGMAMGVLVLLGQAVWVGSTFLAGNILEWAVSGGPGGRVVEVWDLPSYLHWSPWSQGAVTVSVVALWAAYGWRDQIAEFWKFVLAGPAAGLGILGLGGAALGTVARFITRDDDYDTTTLLYVFSIGVMSAAYAYATAYALDSARWLRCQARS